MNPTYGSRSTRRNGALQARNTCLSADADQAPQPFRYLPNAADGCKQITSVRDGRFRKGNDMGRASRRKRLTAGDLLPADLAQEAEKWISDGYLVLQKFTCERCRSRQIIDVANVMCERGGCEECGHVTDLRVRGAGLMSLLVGPTCLGGRHGRPVRRCDICRRCPRCSSTRLRMVVSPTGIPMEELMAKNARGEPISVWVCDDGCEVALSA